MGVVRCYAWSGGGGGPRERSPEGEEPAPAMTQQVPAVSVVDHDTLKSEVSES